MTETRMSSIEGDDETWVEYLKQKLENLGGKEKSKEPPATIHRVPHIIRRGDDGAYEPEIISIGPYHRRNSRLQAMETHKWQYLHSFCSRSGHLSLEETILPKALELKDRARKCYSSDISFVDDKEFVEMLLLDSCFILEVFLKSHDRVLRRVTESATTDPIFGHCTQWVVRCVARDLLLAENQLPFFVLQGFANLGGGKQPPCVSDLAMNFFKDQYLAIHKTSVSQPYGEAKNDYECQLHHLLHLVHTHFVPPPPPSLAKNNSKKSLLIPSKSLLPSFNKNNRAEETQFQGICPLTPLPTVPRAQRLQDSGITFKKGQGKNFLDIKFNFEDGVMEIPHFVVDHYTNTFLRNLIAFEQCYPPSGKCFTMYSAFMDFVVNTDKDVEILHQHGILDHGLGSEQDIALLFNQLCKGLIVEPEEDDKYLLLVHDVINYSNIPWNQWRAKLNRDYFGNPWAIISMTAAVVALSLTFVNSFFSIYRYYHPSP